MGWGKLNPDQTFTVNFSDIVLSSRFRYAGTITMTVETQHELRIKVASGAYVCTKLTKAR